MITMNKTIIGAIIGIIVVSLFALNAIDNNTPLVEFSNSQVLSESSGGIERPDYDPVLLASLIHERANQVRVANNQTVIGYDSAIETAAKAHSYDMLERGYFEHDTPEGTSPADRGANAGFDLCGDVETINIIESVKERERDYNDSVRELNAQTLEHNKKIRELDAVFAARDFQYDRLSNELDAEAIVIDRRVSELAAEKDTILRDYQIANAGFESGIVGRGFSENLADVPLWESRTGTDFDWYTHEELADEVIQTWVNSPPHFQGLIDPYHNIEGLGIAFDYSTNRVLVTQNFC